MTLIQERVELLRQITPAKGNHPAPGNGTPVGCEVELISWAAGEPWSDHTPCVSPVIASFLRSWNDSLDDAGRRMLHARVMARIEDVTATGGDGRDEQRAWMATDCLVRVCAPAWLELAGVEESSMALRALPEITKATVGKAQPTITKARAAGTAAWDAAWTAAGDAAWTAAGTAAGDAAWTAARDAADKALAPTVVELQASALDLLDRMIGDQA